MNDVVSEYLDTPEGRRTLFEAMKPAIGRCFKYLIHKYEMEAQAGLIGNLNLCIDPEKDGQ